MTFQEYFTRQLGKGVRNYVFVGESGAGKSELSINLALLLSRITGERIHYFDLDQTKANIRGRNYTEALEEAGVAVHYNCTSEHIPAVTPGYRDLLEEDSSLTVSDIGGNDTGAAMIGQFREILNRPESIVFLVINVFRPWSSTREHILETLASLRAISGIHKFRIISNPNFGSETTLDDILSGNRRLAELLGETLPISILAVQNRFLAEAELTSGLPAMPVDQFVVQPFTPGYSYQFKGHPND